MSEKPIPEFKIRLDDGISEHDDAPKGSSKPDVPEVKRGNKPQRNPALIPLILIILIFVAAIVGYLDIRNRLLSFHSTGSRETQHLAEDLQSKFSSLSIKFSALEESVKKLSDAQDTLNKSVSSLNDNLIKSNKSITAINSSKADKSSLKESLSSIEKQLLPLTEGIKKTSAETAALSDKLNSDMTDLSAASARVSISIKALQQVIESLQAEKASKKELLTEIDHVENVMKANQSQNDNQAMEVMQSLQNIETRIRVLEAKAGLPSTSSNKSSVSKPVRSTGPATASEPQPPSLPQSGDLIEQDITH